MAGVFIAETIYLLLLHSSFILCTFPQAIFETKCFLRWIIMVFLDLCKHFAFSGNYRLNASIISLDHFILWPVKKTIL
jgi:hypothetical protein